MATDILNTGCVGRVVQVNPACGCTLTRASIRGLTPADMVALGNTEINLARVIMEAPEAKILGIEESSLAMLLRGSVKDIKPDLQEQKVSQQSIILPFIQRNQRQIINVNYFRVLSGTPTPGAGAGGLPLSSWDMVLDLGPSWLASPLQAIERYFVAGYTLFVLTWDNVTTKTARTIQLTVLSAVNADSGGNARAKVTVQPNVTDATWATWSQAQRAVYQPTFGVAQNGANSVSDYESYCHNLPTDLSRNIIVNWLQTSRDTRCVDQAYEDTLAAIMAGDVNYYLKGYVWQSIADQNKYAAMLSEKAWLNSVFFGQQINESQTTTTYTSLPQVVDPVDGTCVLEYKANALGIFTLLNQCNRVIDMGGNELDLNFLFEQLYQIKRYRAIDGVQVLDSMTDRFTAGRILEAMCRYYQVRFNITDTRYYKVNEKITHENIVLFNYNIYDLPDQGVQWAVFHHTYFDDLLSASGTTYVGWDFQTRNRYLWVIDWSDVRVGIGKTSSVQRKNPDPNTADIYKCVIRPNVKTYNLRSKTWTVMVDNPNRHLIICNFSGACPRILVSGCTVPNS